MRQRRGLSWQAFRRYHGRHVASLPTHTNPAACIAAPRAPARRYCAAWPRGCPAARATAPDAARDRARGAGSRPLRRSSGAAVGTPCASRSATTRTRRNSGAAATPSRPRGAARIRSGSSFGLGFMPALSMADSTAKFWLVLWFGALSRPNSPVSRRVFAAAFCCAHDREWIARLQKCGHVKRETGSVQGKGRGGACLSVFRYVRLARSSFQETNK